MAPLWLRDSQDTFFPSNSQYMAYSSGKSTALAGLIALHCNTLASFTCKQYILTPSLDLLPYFESSITCLSGDGGGRRPELRGHPKAQVELSALFAQPLEGGCHSSEGRSVEAGRGGGASSYTVLLTVIHCCVCPSVLPSHPPTLASHMTNYLPSIHPAPVPSSPFLLFSLLPSLPAKCAIACIRHTRAE